MLDVNQLLKLLCEIKTKKENNGGLGSHKGGDENQEFELF